ncbi:7076_t:CDS:1, partial [Dentiscutata heterogama]
GDITASIEFNKKNILEKSEKQIKASAATVILQNSEEKKIVTFNLKSVSYNKLRKELTKVTAERGTIKSHVHKLKGKMENLTIDLEFI